MAKTFKLEVITPEKKLYSGEVEMVIIHTVEGEEGFEAGHTPACMMMDIGELRFYEAGHKQRIAVTTDGFADFTNFGMVVFVSEAKFAEDIDVVSCAAREKELNNLLADTKGMDETLVRQYNADLCHMRVSLKAAGKVGKK